MLKNKNCKLFSIKTFDVILFYAMIKTTPAALSTLFGFQDCNYTLFVLSHGAVCLPICVLYVAAVSSQNDPEPSYLTSAKQALIRKKDLK